MGVDLGLPTGLVTLVFTDIEGSTRLLHELGDTYIELLDVHNEAVRGAVERHAGTEIKTEGDSFFIAFGGADAALAACLDIQTSLARAAWPLGRAPRVRMGVHAGGVTVVGGRDYVGLAVHEAARVTDAAHGGQVLVTDEVAGALAGQLPEGASLRDLGSFSLRDFPEPRRLLQLCHPSLRADFPSLRVSLPRRRPAMPAPPTPLVGRRDELTQVAELLAGPTRLLTLTGPGGAGKTRLAIEAAWSAVGLFPGGAWFVDLASITDPAAVLPAVLRAVGGAQRTGDVLAAIVDHLPSEQSLIVVDNLEQVMGAAVDVARLLEAAPALTMLATSRERLRLRAEYEVTLDGLGPEAGHALFVARAAAAGTPVAADDREAVDALCRHVDNMPLAIELAAGQLRDRAPATLLKELEFSLAVLSEGAADLPARHQALHATVAWSWDLLDADERGLLAALAVIGGSADRSLVAALAAAAGVGRSPGALVEALLDKNLLRPTDGKPDEPRVAVLEVIRQFAEEKLTADPDAHLAAVEAHAAWCADLATRAEAYLAGPDEAPWLDRLDYDRENLALAMVRADGPRLFALVQHLPAWWTARGLWSEARQWLAIALEEGTDDLAVLGSVWAFSAYYAERQGDLQLADEQARRALGIARRDDVADPALEARALNTLGDVERTMGNAAGAAARFREAVDAAMSVGSDRHVAVALSNLGVLAWESGDTAAAKAHWSEALRMHEERIREPRAIAILTGDLGLVHRLEGDLDGAESCFSTSLAMARDLGDPIPTADALLNLGTVAKDRGDEAAARAHYLDAIELYSRVGHRASVASTLLHLALATDDAAQARGWVERARVLAIEIGHARLTAEAEEMRAALDEIAADG